jgi:hypothetical protein
VHDNCTIESFSELNNQEITHNTKTSVGKKKDKIFMAAFKVTADQSFSEGA